MTPRRVPAVGARGDGRVGSRPVPGEGRGSSRSSPGPSQARVRGGPCRRTRPSTASRFGAVLRDPGRRPPCPASRHWQSPSFLSATFPGQPTSGPSILGELLSAGLGVQGMLWSTQPRVHRAGDPRARLAWSSSSRLPRPVSASSGDGGGVIQDLGVEAAGPVARWVAAPRSAARCAVRRRRAVPMAVLRGPSQDATRRSRKRPWRHPPA